jgi:hypothetical protein
MSDPTEAFVEALVQRVRESLAAEPLPVRYLSRGALAEHLGLTERTIRTWRGAGMPGVKVGKTVMYDVAEVNAWISEHR